MNLLPNKVWQRSLLGIGFLVALYLLYWLIYHFSREAHAF